MIRLVDLIGRHMLPRLGLEGAIRRLLVLALGAERRRVYGNPRKIRRLYRAGVKRPQAF